MSATTLLTETEPRIAEFKFIDPDNSIGPDDRALFALPAVKEFKIESLPIRDYRSAPELVRGPAGLDKHGFTLVNHTSALSGDGWFSESALEDIYFDEVRTLVKNVTGAKDAVINSVVFRRKAPERSLNPVAYRKKGDELVDVKKIELNRPMVTGKTVDSSLEPARGMHCDYTRHGLLDVVRHGRADFRTAGAAVIAAEDEAARTGKPYDGPRYAAFSVWRPVKTVRRDPVAVADWGSVNKEAYVPISYRAPNEKGEYHIEAYSIKPSEDSSKQKWYYVPEQKPDEVLVIKFADSKADQGLVSGSTAHGSPNLPGSEKEEARESVEARVLAFW